jgi:hypothetical protein
VNVPGGVEGALNEMVCSTAERSTMGLAKVTVTGCAMPTVWPGAGWMLATSVAVATLAELVVTDPVIAIAATPNAASTYRIFSTLPS